MEKIKARRRTRRSRLRCSASPSTRHDRKEPRLSFCTTPSASETARGSSGITHLQSFSARICGRLAHRGSRRKFAALTFRGSLLSSRRPAPRSQGCEVARVLEALDTTRENKFPGQKDKL